MKNNCESWWQSTTLRHCDPARFRGHSLGVFLSVLTLLTSSGCTYSSPKLSLGPKPWQHDLMAQPAMQIDAYPIEAGMNDHIYFSKEASSGGRAFAGGGCGCN